MSWSNPIAEARNRPRTVDLWQEDAGLPIDARTKSSARLCWRYDPFRRRSNATLGLGIALLVAGAALLVLEAHVVSYGILGITGLAAMVFGAALAIDAAGGGLTLVLAVALTLAVVGATLLLGTVRRVALVARRRARTGAEAMVGRIGVVRSSSLPCGQVFVDGALWRARPLLDEGEVLHVGDPIVVEHVSGLTLGVRRAEEWEIEP